jgi:hypothetical protein
MHVQTITMDPRIASIHFRDYQVRCRKHRLDRKAQLDAEAKRTGRELRRIQIAKTLIEKEDRQLLLAYKALKEGQRLLHLPSVIRDAGWTKNWLPKLAIARATAKQVTFFTGSNPYFEGGPWDSKVENSVKVTHSIFPAEITNGTWRQSNNHPSRAVALVPIVPPHLRPDNIEKYHILWEAEWKFQAPGDPILLSRVNDDTYAVIAQWDLTPLEQRLLESRSL